VEAARTWKRNTGIKITESFAMWPRLQRERPLLRAPPVAPIFAVGKIDPATQVLDYHLRKGMTLQGSRALAPAPISIYDPRCFSPAGIRPRPPCACGIAHAPAVVALFTQSNATRGHARRRARTRSRG